MSIGTVRQNGFSHIRSQFGEVASCSDMKTRNAIRQPAKPYMR